MNRHAVAAVVVGGDGVPRRDDIRGVMTKRSIADAAIQPSEVFVVKERAQSVR